MSLCSHVLSPVLSAIMERKPGVQLASLKMIAMAIINSVEGESRKTEHALNLFSLYFETLLTDQCTLGDPNMMEL